MANDPVLQRSMFQKQTPIAPSIGLGIDSVTTPDQNAKALKSMFQPTVSLGMPTQMLQQEQQPVQGFKQGGEVINGVVHFQEGGLNSGIQRFTPGQELDLAPSAPNNPVPRFNIEPPIGMPEPNKVGPAERYVPKTPIMRQIYSLFEATPERQSATDRATEDQRRQVEIDKARQENPVPTIFSEVTDADREAAKEKQRIAIERAAASVPRSPPRSGISSINVPSMLDRDRADEPRMPTSPAERKLEDTSVKTNLDDIKADRRATEAARTSAERRENMLLALMQAGFAMAAGRSPNAISNIGAGGQAGIAAFASMERARREDESLRRREQLQLDIAKMQYDRDPEAIRTYAILGGYKPGDPKESYSAAVSKGFNATQSKEGPKLAAAIINNPMSAQFYSQQELKDLADYARRGIIGMGAAGKEAFPGFSGTLATPPAR